eukprot:TRINITY_DN4567_c0_g2_i2.p1 TRINITY_DN4567_c0_g2~~TRINITY_DN4567_c0_g2_i2.p1  ORF type:complete len:539 (-),score=109.91 TRINITY_DN4567_c0_g2_i2:16-1632(-)
MSLREFSPLYQWGFSLRTPKFLVPLLNNNVFIFGKEAVQSSSSLSLLSSNESKFLADPIIRKRKKVKNDCVRLEDDPVELSHNTATCDTIITPHTTSSHHKDSQSTHKNPSTQINTAQNNTTQTIKDKSDAEILVDVISGKIPSYNLEQILEDKERGVKIRRLLLELNLSKTHTPNISTLPYQEFDYDSTWGRNCENVIGFVQIPVGVAGPLLINDRQVQIPMATTEGCLVASTARGCKAITMSGGATCVVVDDGMTRGPVLQVSGVKRASELKMWIDDPENFEKLVSAFASTSRFGKLRKVKVAIAGRNVYLRFRATTGDAMGMNMVTKGVEECLKLLQSTFPDVEILSLSGNYCTDKKPASMNWTEGRGKYVICEALIKKQIVEKILKTSVDALVYTNINKNLVGSAMAGSIGGFNAHAANMVSAIFLATGQDIAQNIESSNCITLMEKHGEDLYITCSMPSVEVATVGGGTHLAGQAACLDILGLKGANVERPGENAEKLAQVVCGAVLAGELSLMSALTAGHLTRSHMQLNRAK